jgi:WD40 repeat protein
VVQGTFDLLTTAQLPVNAGSILTLQTLPNRIDELVVVSGHDQVFKARLGSATTFELMLESAGKCVSLIPHPREESFFTASSENRIRKWVPSEGREMWVTAMPSKGSSISVHPSGEVVAVACGRDIAVLTASEGVHVSLLPVSQADLTCISYSQNGLLLAAGSSDGCLYFMHVADEGLSYQSLSILRVSSRPLRHTNQTLLIHTAASSE